MDIKILLSFAIVTAVTGAVLRRYFSEYALLIMILGAVSLSAAALTAFSPVMSLINRLAGFIPDGEKYVLLLLKCVGTAILTEIASDICSDCGEAALAKSAAICGRIGILLLALPVFTSLAEIILSMIKA